MIETIILDYLNALPEHPAPALAEVPEGGVTPPCWIVERTGGGGMEGCIGTATLAIRSYGATLYEAAALNETLKAAMAGAAALPEIARCRLNTDYNYTDTAKKQYRYQAVYDIIHY